MHNNWTGVHHSGAETGSTQVGLERRCLRWKCAAQRGRCCRESWFLGGDEHPKHQRLLYMQRTSLAFAFGSELR